MRTLRYAFKQTIPVMLGYLVMGMAFGLLLENVGYNALWAFGISVIVYAGSMQFVLVDLLAGGASILTSALMTLSVNSRHIFYGLSFIERFKNMGARGLYMIFSLTDETYSLLCGTKVPADLNENDVFFTIAWMNHSYWITGCVLGALIGSWIAFDTTGADFAMTALFVVIFIEQWREAKSHLPALAGLICGVVCLTIFGPDQFILPTLVLTVGALFLLRKPIERGEGKKS